nr:DUF3575 domain-containing protein [Prevotella sp.]
MKKIIVLLLTMLSVISVRAQMIAAHTDLALWALQTYNLGAEMTINNRSTLCLDGAYVNKPYGQKDFKIYSAQPELRYYFGGRPMYHHFVGISGIAAKYQITWKDDYHSGTAFGAGLTFGYVFPITRDLTIDAHTGVGIVGYNDSKNHTDNKLGYMLVPTKIGITLSYIIR